MLLALLCLMAADYRMAGEARPMYAFEDAGGGLWVIRQPAGSFPEVWTFTDGVGHAVALPEGCRNIAGHPSQRGLLLVMPDNVEMRPLQDKSLGQGTVLAKLSGESSLAPPWLPAQRLTHQKTDYLCFFRDNSLHILATDPTAGTHKILNLPPLESKTDETAEIRFMSPGLTVGEAGIQWMWAGKAHLFNPKGAPDHQLVEPPATLPLEKALGMATPSGRYWLVHGGGRGDFSSFGWRLQDDKGDKLFEGEGILTRFGLDFQKEPRLFVFTITNSVMGNLFNAFKGKTDHTLHLLSQAAGKWRRATELEITTVKSKDKAFAIDWSTDLNADGLTELIVCDEDSGVRVYAGEKDGGLEKKPNRIDDAPDALLFLPTRLVFGIQTNGEWRLRTREGL